MAQYLGSIATTIAADKEVWLNITGHFFTIEQASHSNFSVSINGDPFIAFDAGLIYRMPDGQYFDRIIIRDDSGAGITLTVKYGAGDYVDGRVSIVGGLSISTPVESKGADTLRTTADASVLAVTTAAVLAADLNRREALVTNLDAATTIRVGDASTGAARGLPVPPGATVTLDTTAAVYIHNPSAAAVSVALCETVNV